MVVGMNQPPEDWQRLADHVRTARKDAGFPTRRSLAKATGITERTLGKLENGERVGADTLDVVAKAVGWPPDGPRRILAGGDLEPVPSPGVPPVIPEPPTAAEEALEKFPGDLVAQAIWRQPNTPEAEKWEMIATLERKRREIQDRKSSQAS